ncbi:MAG: glycosyl hydrolase family protein, partial [Sphingobacteriia bacterium]|nr:glycosyl hydrolase family protein [Sphingobacteriia bacterium]
MKTKTKNNLKFPKDFLWGTATSAYQIEGNNSNS